MGVAYEPSLLRRWCEELTRGLEHVHRARIVHGALHPSNILVGVDDVIKIAGFNRCASASVSVVVVVLVWLLLRLHFRVCE